MSIGSFVARLEVTLEFTFDMTQYPRGGLFIGNLNDARGSL